MKLIYTLIDWMIDLSNLQLASLAMALICFASLAAISFIYGCKNDVALAEIPPDIETASKRGEMDAKRHYDGELWVANPYKPSTLDAELWLDSFERECDRLNRKKRA